jgi:hypothetical protein
MIIITRTVHERVYNTKQIYYHGGTFGNNDSGISLGGKIRYGEPLFFVTPDKRFAQSFLTPPNTILTKFIFRPSIKMFDSEDKNDLLSLKQFFIKFPQEIVLEYYDIKPYLKVSADELIDLLKRSKGHWQIMETPCVIKAIKKLGYDCFRIFEKGHENIAVFYANALKQIK